MQEEIKKEEAAQEETALETAAEESGEHSEKKEEKSPAQKSLENVYDFADVLVSAILVIFILFTFFFRLVGVDGPSMNPTLNDGDKLLVTSIPYSPSYGDVVIITQPNVYNEPIVKRVIATEGQTVDIDFKTGTVKVDGKVLNEPYINMRTTRYYDVAFPVKVPENCIFVMGDNRSNSTDSRSSTIGFIKKEYVLGKVIGRVSPAGQWHIAGPEDTK